MTTKEDRLTGIISRLSHDDSDERRWAVYDLEDVDPVDSIDHLITALLDENRAVREAASEVLETVPAEMCTKKLTPYLGSERIEIRNAAAAILVTYGNAAVHDLLPALFHQNEDVRKFGADILGLAKNEDAVSGLCMAAMQDGVINVRSSAVEALGKIGSTNAVPTLIELIACEDGPRAEAVEALGLIGDPSIVDRLEGLLSDPDPLVVFAAVDALGNSGEKDTIEKLKEQLEACNPLMRVEIGKAILKLGYRHEIPVFVEQETRVHETLVECLMNGDTDVSDLLKPQLKLNPPRAVFPLLLELKDKLDPILLVEIIGAVKNIPEFESHIIQLTSHEDEWVAFSAVEALEGFDTLEARGAVLDILEIGEGMKVASAIKYAVIWDVEESVPFLERLQSSENEDIRATAIRALQEFNQG